jgi:cytochrome c oxidase subunit 1
MVLIASFLQSRPEVRRLTAGWMLLALSALALSTLCAVWLIAARTPWLGTPAGAGALFGRALVLHVSLAVVVWFLASAAALWTLVAGLVVAGLWQWLALALGACGMSAMVLALFLDGGQAVLANYVPVLQHPVFFSGLGLFVLGVALCGGLSLAPIVRRTEATLWRLGALLSIAVAAVALLATVASLGLAQAEAVHVELLTWGPGHVLQFVHVILLMCVWCGLGEEVLGQPLAPRRWLVAGLGLAAAPVLAVPLIYASYPMASADFRQAFTWLMAWGAWPAATLLALRLLWLLTRAGRRVWQSAQTPALVLSIVLFLTGCVLGAMIRNDSTMVPAHYHGTVGAVTLAYMALAYRLLPALGASLRVGVLLRWQPVLYGAGLMVLALALAWSGSLGVPRKTLHMDVIVQYPAYFAAMGLAGLGGLLAISGAALFVINVLRSLGTGAQSLPAGRRDVRRTALVMTVGLVVVIGMLLAYGVEDHGSASTATRADPAQDAAGHAAQMRKAEIEQRFNRGVTLLNEKKFDAAASEWHRVLALAPQMPEAQVNMGFAMLGVERYAVARDFFDTAINLNTRQFNAYYGLAMALEGLGDLPGALGAMRSYVHLNKAEDAYVVKARAAIWEWESALEKTRTDSGKAASSSAAPRRAP